MALIFRLIRLALPLIIGFLLIRLVRNLVTTFGSGGYTYQGNSRNSSSNNGQGGPSAGRQRANVDPYAVLGCSRRDSDEDIRKCYRKMVAKYHPDKFIGQELDDEFIELATMRFKEIQNAYDQIRKMRGMH